MYITGVVPFVHDVFHLVVVAAAGGIDDSLGRNIRNIVWWTKILYVIMKCAQENSYNMRSSLIFVLFAECNIFLENTTYYRYYTYVSSVFIDPPPFRVVKRK